MISANRYFDESAPKPEPAKLRAWRDYRNIPDVTKIVVDVRREKDWLTYLPGRIYVFFQDAEGISVHDSDAEWEPALEEWLIDEQGARAVTVDSEKVRFSLLLTAGLRPVRERFGDIVFNETLLTVVRQGELAQHPEIVKVLEEIGDVGKPEEFEECAKWVEEVFFNQAARLHHLYPDDRDTAIDVFDGALARYLDERFNVSNMRALFGRGPCPRCGKIVSSIALRNFANIHTCPKCHTIYCDYCGENPTIIFNNLPTGASCPVCSGKHDQTDEER